MYDSTNASISIDQQTKNHRTQILRRLYGMEFNLIPISGKHPPCIEWKQFQTVRISVEKLKEWMRGTFPAKNEKNFWKPEILNFALITGATPWSSSNPGIIVVDSDDEEAEALVKERCPETPMMQVTGKDGFHRVYRRPEDHISNRQKTVIDGKNYNLDIRGDGGYIMAPGSIHPKTQKLYRELEPWTPELLQQCPVYDPTWLACERSQPKRTTSVAVTSNFASDDHQDRISDIDLPGEQRESMARRYLDSVPGTQQGDGADRRCTALTMKLLYGFSLPAEIVQAMLCEWGQQEDQLDDAGGWYPWTDEDIARKIDWCLGEEYRGEIGDRLSCHRELSDLEAKVDGIVQPFEVGPTINPKDQLEIARLFFRDYFTASGDGALIHHQITWHHWTGKRYETTSDDDIKAKLWKWLSRCSVRTKERLVSCQPSRALVTGVMDALKAVANQSSSIESPCWLSHGPEQVIAFDNGLLDVDGFLKSEVVELMDHTPQWFSSNCLPHRFDASASCPQWLEFLSEVFDDDQERIDTLQQWFGYNLIADNRQHKIAMLIGPPRSGKGTTMAVMSAMLGKHNIANTSLASLGGRFGLEPLVGKLSALIDEGHLGKFSDTSQILERLKAISGGSEQTVDRKGVAALSSVALKIRFTMAVNELPRLSDSSAAMRARLLVIPYFNTYEGNEDFGLVDRLLTEIPGITNWALQGLRRLKEVGRFRNPSVGEEILREFEHLSSPIKAFIDDCCVVNSDASVRRQDLQLAWHMWCEQKGHVPGSDADFGRKLRAVIPRVSDVRKNIEGRRERHYAGLTLSPEARTDISNRRLGA